VGARRDAVWRHGARRKGAHHPDEQRRRQRAHHRPGTNKVVGEITGIEVGHGAAAAPDGSRLYVSNEADTTLDVVDGRTLRVISKVPLSGHPNNIAASRDGARVYVAIRQAPAPWTWWTPRRCSA
jgi:YVTN family beta-propeller protein